MFDLGKNHNQIKDSPVTNVSRYAAKLLVNGKANACPPG
jgi:hypothetical protein